MGCVSTRAILVPAGTVMVVASGAGFADESASCEMVFESSWEVGSETRCARQEIASSKVEVRAIPCLILVLARNRNVVAERVRKLRSFADIWCLLLKTEAFPSSGEWRVLVRSLAIRPRGSDKVR
jgi:hypothetical protein